MNISSLSGLTSLINSTGLQSQQNLQKASAKLNTAIAALANNTGAGGDINSLSAVGQLQANTGDLKQISANLVQASSLAQVADGGLKQLQTIGQSIASLAQQANLPSLSESEHKSLDLQFKQLVQQIDSIVGNTSFNGKQLLGGESGDLSIGNLSSASLFGSSSLFDLSPALAGDAIDKINAAQASVGAFLKATDYAAASVDSALANQVAANSSLSEADFINTASEKSQTTLQNNAALAVAAQGNRLPPALLQLVG